MHTGYRGWVALYECTEAGVPTELLAYHKVTDVHPTHGYNLDSTKGTWICCGGSDDPQKQEVWDHESQSFITEDLPPIICNISSGIATIYPDKWYLIAHGSRGRTHNLFRYSAMTSLSSLNVAHLKAANPNFEEFETGPLDFYCYRNMNTARDEENNYEYNQGLGCPGAIIGMAPATDYEGIIGYQPNVGFSGYIIGPGEDVDLYPGSIFLEGYGHEHEVSTAVRTIYPKVNGVWQTSRAYVRIQNKWVRVSKGFIKESDWRNIK